MSGRSNKYKPNTLAKQENRINAIQFQQSTYGAVVPVGFGTFKIAGNVIDYVDFKATAHTTQQRGGKGGGSSSDISSTTYTYSARFIIGLCQGTISGINKAWENKKVKSLNKLGLSLYKGTDIQAPWGDMITYHPTRALNYPNLAYVAGKLNLGTNPAAPNLTFEIKGEHSYSESIIDANPKEVIYELLTNSVYGALFPAEYIADYSDFSNYCIANGIFISPAYTDQQEAQQRVSDIADIANSEFVWSQGKLKLIPAGDSQISGNGVIWTPDLTPVYDLTEDDFLADSPVACNRSMQADVYNSVKLEYLNRADDYNVEVIEVQDQANKEVYGDRPANSINAHIICDKIVAKKIAQLALDKIINLRNRYTFKLPIKYILLEPMDLITITVPELGLDRELVRIISIKESGEDEFEFEVEEMSLGCASPALYPNQEVTRTSLDYNSEAGFINTPVIFEPPFALTQNNLQVWFGASSSNPLWGGADVWISDDGITYKNIGSITNPIRQGILTAQLPYSEVNPDITNTLSVDMSMSNSELLSGTQADADNLNTLCYVDGELLAYQTTALTGINQYDLSYLNRGAYDSEVLEHDPGVNFARIDEAAFFKYPYNAEDVGKTVYLKFQSFNVFGAGIQQLEVLDAVPYTIQGSALQIRPEDVKSFSAVLNLNSIIFNWAEISGSNVSYEIREGKSWVNSQVIATGLKGSSYTQIPVTPGLKNYWIKGIGANGAYSENAKLSSINITEIQAINVLLQQNCLTKDGAFTNCYFYNDAVKVSSSILWQDLTPTNWKSDGYYSNNGLWGPDVASSAIYETPVYDIGYSLNSLVSINYDFFTEDEKNSLLIEITYSEDNITWSDYSLFSNGSYIFRYYKFRLTFTNPNNNPSVVSKFIVNIDVPDLLQDGIQDIPAAKTTVTFPKAFHGVDGLKPVTQITIYDGVVGDQYFLTNLSNTSFDIEIKNSGSTVARTIHWYSKLY